MKSNFGNYVLKTALSLAEGGIKGELTKRIQECLSLLPNKKLNTKWTEILEGTTGGVSKQMKPDIAAEGTEDRAAFAEDLE
jgi:hypothetical protein